MLRGLSYSENDIGRSLKGAEGLFGGEGTGLTEAEQEILNFAQSQAKLGVRVTAKALLERFEAKPYGWPTAAILCVTASLIGRGKLEARSDSTVLEGEVLERALRNSNVLPNILLAPQVEFQPSQMKALKDFYREFFDAPPEGNEAKVLGAECASAFDRLKSEINILLAQKSKFPFLSALNGVLDAVTPVANKPAVWYITDLPKHQDALLDLKEDILDPIRNFMNGPQRAIYEDVDSFLTEQAENFTYAGQIDAEAMQAILRDPKCYKGSAIQGLKTRLYDLKSTLDLKIIEERKAVEAEIDSCKSKIESLPEFAKISASEAAKLLSSLERARQGLRETTLIAGLRDRANSVRSQIYPQLLEEVDRLARPVVKEPPSPVSGMAEPPVAAPVPTPASYVNGHQLKVTFSKPYLTVEGDVEDYLIEMRKTLLAEIRNGKRIIV
jgi:hypothetical protein